MLKSYSYSLWIRAAFPIIEELELDAIVIERNMSRSVRQLVRDYSNNREEFFINRDLLYDRTCQYVFLQVSVAAIHESSSALSRVVESWPQNKSKGASGCLGLSSRFILAFSWTFHDLPVSFRGLRGIFTNFCPPTLIFPKIPRGSRRFFFLISPSYLYCVLRDCLLYPFLSFSRSFHSSFISYFLSLVRDRPPATRLAFITASSMPGFSADLFSRGLSLSSRSSLASSFFLLLNPVISGDFSERLPPPTPPSRIPTRDNPYKLEH